MFELFDMIFGALDAIPYTGGPPGVPLYSGGKTTKADKAHSRPPISSGTLGEQV